MNDEWREDDTCSYCGSLNPDKVIRLLKEGGYRIIRTDKNYKIYIEQLRDSINKSELPNNQTMWKVYLHHFNHEQIDELNRALGYY